MKRKPKALLEMLSRTSCKRRSIVPTQKPWGSQGFQGLSLEARPTYVLWRITLESSLLLGGDVCRLPPIGLQQWVRGVRVDVPCLEMGQTTTCNSHGAAPQGGAEVPVHRIHKWAEPPLAPSVSPGSFLQLVV